MAWVGLGITVIKVNYTQMVMCSLQKCLKLFNCLISRFVLQLVHFVYVVLFNKINSYSDPITCKLHKIQCKQEMHLVVFCFWKQVFYVVFNWVL